MTELTRETIIPFLTEIFERRGAEEYLGEQVTIAEHMLQGAQLAEEANAPEDVVAAALLHDVGHFTHDFPTDAANLGIDSQHEEAGARVLEGWFPDVVIDCIRGHVAAKRYLCATKPDYFDRLSEASVLSLKLQGGPMTKEEVAAFDKNPNLQAILKVRIWDDVGKNPDHQAPAFAHFRPVLERVAARHAQSL